MNYDKSDRINEWKNFSNDYNHNLIEKCLKISQILFNEKLNIHEYIAKSRISIESIIINISNTTQIKKILFVLNNYVLNNRLKCDLSNSYQSNFIDFVIDNKRGNSLTLAIIYSEIANQIVVDATIIELNNRFLCKYNNVIIDPQNGKPIIIKNCKVHNEDIRNLSTKNDLDQKRILIKLLQNLKLSYAKSYSYNMARICIDMILSIKLIPQEIRDKGIIEELSLNHNYALELLNYYLKLEPDASDIDYILELVSNIQHKINQ